MHPNEQNGVQNVLICKLCGIESLNYKEADRHHYEAHTAKAVKEFYQNINRVMKEKREMNG